MSTPVTFSRDVQVAIVGAGPYGLSIAAHLGARNIEYRIFGAPMQAWQMSAPGMFLKSEGCASNLSHPSASCTLQQYCKDCGLPYAHSGAPIPVAVFTGYGLRFQKQFISNVEDTLVTRIDASPAGFQLRLETGEGFTARKVVVATGMSHTAYIPTILAELPSEFVSHSSSCHRPSDFSGRNVTVIGAGQSALETAALLHEAGAQVRLVTRCPAVRWNPPPITNRRSFRERIARPSSNLGDGIGPWLYSNAPMLFRYLPQKTRLSRVRKALGPAGAWWLRDRVVGRFELLTAHSLRSAEISNQRLALRLRSSDGALRDILTDHVVAATGYRFGLCRLPFLTQNLLSRLCSVAQTPILSRCFESSVAGLYFSGFASANQFGPAMRFLAGAGFAARCISRSIAG